MLSIVSLSVFLAAAVKATLEPIQVLNSTNSYEDKLQWNITSLFKVSDIDTVTCTSDSPAVTFFNQNTTLFSKSLLPYNFGDEPEISEIITNQSFYAIYDNSNILIETLNLDHESFGVPIVARFSRPGANAVCTDLALNSKLNRIYLVCMSNVSESENQINLVEFDARTGATIGKPTVIKSDQYKVVHRLQIKIVSTWSAPGVVTNYVIVYDQGVSTGITSTNRWFAVFSGPDSGSLIFAGYAELSNDSGFKFAYMHDIYGYQNQLLVMGQPATGEKLSMAYCGFELQSQQPIKVNCSNYVVESVYDTTIGYLGVMNTGQYVEVNLSDDASTRSISICDIISSFYSGNFIDKSSCTHIPTTILPQDVYVSYVEGNVHQVILKYSHFDSTYAGYSVHNFDLLDQYADIHDSLAPHVVPIGQSLVRLTKLSMNITRQVEPYIYVDVSKLEDNIDNIVKIKCTDADGGSAQNEVMIFKLSDMRLGVYGRADKIPLLATYKGQSLVFELDAHEVVGNDLNLTIEFPAEVLNYTQTQVYDTSRGNVDFQLKVGTGNFRKLHFSGRYATAQDSRGTILVFNCSFIDMVHIVCMEAANILSTGNQITLQEDIIVAFGYLITWSTDETAEVTTVYVFDGENTIHFHQFAGIASDAMITEIGESAYIAFTYPDEGIIRSFQLNQKTPDRLLEIDEINTGLSGREYFCPQKIWYDPMNSTMIDVFNYCPGKTQDILRYKYPPVVASGKLQLFLVSYIPINFAYKDVEICSVGNEFVIYSKLSNGPNLRSVGVLGDRNSYGFGIDALGHDDFGLGVINSFNCVPKSQMFTTTSRTNEGCSAVKPGTSGWYQNNPASAV